MASEEPKLSGRRTASRLGLQYHVSSGAVRKYGEYSSALEKILKKAPEIVPHILSGNYKISHANIVALSEMEPEEMRKTTQKQLQSNSPFVRYSDSRKDFSNEDHVAELPIIKTMPPFDPDAEIAGLTLTIPSWTSSMERVHTVTDWTIVSGTARAKLEVALIQHHHEVLELLRIVKGEK